MALDPYSSSDQLGYSTPAEWTHAAEHTHARAIAAIEDIAHGRMVIVVDDFDRENEGDLVMAADCVTGEAVNFMITHGRGLVCVPMESNRLRALRLADMTQSSNDPFGTRFTVSVDLDVPGSTGISAWDRAATIRQLASPETTMGELRRPGHVFPLRYADGGVLARRGHTEASVDLARLAGHAPAGVICEIIASDGTMLRGRDLEAFATEHSLRVVSIEDLVAYRLQHNPSVADSPATPRQAITRETETIIPAAHGVWRALGYLDSSSGAGHLALVMGSVETEDAPVVRIHSECLTGDVLRSQRCDCGEQLDAAMRLIAAQGTGVIIYVRGHEGRGIGLIDKLRAYALQDQGRDTVDANLELGLPIDARDYRQSAGILADLGITRVRLATNNPRKTQALRDAGIDVVSEVRLAVSPTSHSMNYLLTKKRRLGHHLDLTATLPRDGCASPRGDSRIVR